MRPKRAGGRTAVTVASLPCASWNATRARDVDIRHAVAVGEHERLVVAEPVAERA